ncbi:DUF2293 domain-containing protein [Amycolatopsis sp. 195334CR]|uniref:DUF2293 domain-containing protein n=1 Tax=Amycolatopsis sp. 195334CR TaxID=2814588 RepID=UPI001A900173|nr:DUF2293 domain-containing protein [Amycolatopsis sp. 195334CR]MBN6041585.1 DUF2293 domain-containing protein [Amycolatopsis sp. 195334CR]
MVTPEPPKIQRRVISAADIALKTKNQVVPLEVLNALGWLPSARVDEWRRGQTAHLGDSLAVDAAKVRTALDYLSEWAAGRGLRATEASYLAATRDRRPLRFTADGDETLERLFHTHWVSADLSEKRLERLRERQSKAPDLVVVRAAKSWVCGGCGLRGDVAELVFEEDQTTLCLACADFDHLRFLASGNAALSRRAKTESKLSAVVVEFNRRRKRYQRVGTLVEEDALERAEQRCLDDEDVRARRRERDAERRVSADADFQAELAAAILRSFPGCPEERARTIAEHAGVRGSGRVGRSAAGRALDEDAVRAAVIASIRHLDTDYDDLLMAGVPRAEARERIRSTIDRVVARWGG